MNLGINTKLTSIRQGSIFAKIWKKKDSLKESALLHAIEIFQNEQCPSDLSLLLFEICASYQIFWMSPNSRIAILFHDLLYILLIGRREVKLELEKNISYLVPGWICSCHHHDQAVRKAAKKAWFKAFQTEQKEKLFSVHVLQDFFHKGIKILELTSDANIRMYFDYEADENFLSMIKFMVIDAMCYFVESSAINKSNISLIENALWTMHAEELARYPISKAVLSVISCLWRSSVGVSAQLDLMGVRVLMCSVQHHQKDLMDEEGTNYLVEALESSSEEAVKVLSNSIESIVEAMNFIVHGDCRFKDVVLGHTSRHGYSSKRVTRLIASFFHSVDRTEETCLKSLLGTIVWQNKREPDEEMLQTHLRGVLFSLLWGKGKLKYTERNFIEHFLREASKVENFENHLIEIMESFVVAVFTGDSSSVYNKVSRDYMRIDSWKESNAREGLCEIGYVYFSDFFISSEKNRESILRIIFQSFHSGENTQHRSKEAALRTLKKIRSNNSFCRSPGLLTVVLDIFREIRESKDEDIEKHMFEIICRDESILGRFAKNPGITPLEIPVGLRISPNSVVLRETLRNFISGVRSLAEFESLCEVMEKLSPELRAFHKEDLLQRAFGIVWNSDTFQHVSQFFTEREGPFLLSTLESVYSQLSQENLISLYDKSIISPASIEKFMTDYVLLMKEVYPALDPVMQNVDIAFGLCEPISSRRRALSILTPVVIKAMDFFDVSTLIQVVPLQKVGSHVEMVDSILFSFEETSFEAALNALHSASKTQFDFWNASILHIINRKVRNKFWQEAVTHFIWTHTISLNIRAFHFPMEIHAANVNTVSMALSQLEIPSWDNLQLISYALSTIEHCSLEAINLIAISRLTIFFTSRSDPFVDIERNVWFLNSLFSLITLHKRYALDIFLVTSTLLSLVLRISSSYSLTVGKQFPSHTSPFALFLKLFRSIGRSLIQIIRVDAQIVPSVAVWTDIGSIYVSILTWALKMSSLENDSIALDDLHDTIIRLGDFCFTQEATSSMYNKYSAATYRNFDFFFSVLDKLHTDSNFPTKSAQLLFWSLTRTFSRVAFISGPKEGSNDMRLHTFSLIVRHLNSECLMFLSDRLTEFHWNCLLSVWVMLIEWMTSKTTQEHMSAFFKILRTKNMMAGILDALSMFFSEVASISADSSRMKFSCFFDSEADLPSRVLIFLKKLFEHLPSSLVQWYNRTPVKIKKAVEKIVDKWIAAELITKEIQTLKSASFTQEDDVVVSCTGNTFALTLTIDTESIQVMFRYPQIYPLRPVEPSISQLESRRTIFGMKKESLRSILLVMITKCKESNGALEAIQFLLGNLRNHVAGKSPCPICCSIIHPDTKKMPESKCGVCRDSVYHQKCIFDWFKKSGNNSCPTCRSAWNSWKS